MSRRRFIKSASLYTLSAGVLLAGSGSIFKALAATGEPPAAKTPSSHLYPAKRNAGFKLDRALTEESVAAAYNNFYEFSSGKTGIANYAEKMKLRPWTVEVAGLVENPGVYDIDDIVKRLPLEERLYRFRCVEAWAMVVPWTGFQLSEFIKMVKPLSSAKYVRFQTFYNKEWSFEQKIKFWLPWPYEEGLTMAEATNELAMLVTGIYGHELPRQHGAPIRLIVPWKYGFKSIKSIVRIEFTREEPKTFWHTLVPDEYDFLANVNPQVPHPRWSQATERLIGSDERRPTIKYNGYGEFVAGLYK